VARPKNTTDSKKVHPSLPDDVYRCLELLVESGRYGSNVGDVARYLLIRSVDELTRANVLPLALAAKDREPSG
jgi:Arc/MetJ-type ribon-helix-helix transcriptional regulator